MKDKELLDNFYKLYLKGKDNCNNSIDYFKARHFLIKAVNQAKEQERKRIVEELKKLRQFGMSFGEMKSWAYLVEDVKKIINL